jgi:hypothetical protein
MVSRTENESDELSAIRSAGRAIGPLHDPIRVTRPGDWLDEHEEPGQSFEEYCRSDSRRPTTVRTTMYLQPIGEFNAAGMAVIESTAELLADFYGVPVRMLEPMDVAWVPHQARRLHPYTGVEQILTKFVLRLHLRARFALAGAALNSEEVAQSVPHFRGMRGCNARSD